MEIQEQKRDSVIPIIHIMLHFARLVEGGKLYVVQPDRRVKLTPTNDTILSHALFVLLKPIQWRCLRLYHYRFLRTVSLFAIHSRIRL